MLRGARRISTKTMALTVSPAPTSRVRAAHWKDDGPSGFKNPWPSAKGEHHFSDVVKFMWGGIGLKGHDPVEGAAAVPRATPDFTLATANAASATKGVKATWLGHACVLVQYPAANGGAGLNVLFDPVFENRCGPTQLFGAPKRFTPVPCTLEELPEIHVVVLSHNHYDHLSTTTLTRLFQRFPSAPLLMPLNTKHITHGVGAKTIRELDWWESVTVTRGEDQWKFTAAPAQHMTARTTFDLAKSLWCSWAIHAGNGEGQSAVWFSGDTGYSAVDKETHDIDPSRPVCPEFKKIGEELGPFDLAFVPIGAYLSRSFLSTVHCSPVDAARVFKDVRAKKAFAIHWGTWDLSHEPLAEPPQLLAQARKQLDISEDELDIIALGGSVTV